MGDNQGVNNNFLIVTSLESALERFVLIKDTGGLIFDLQTKEILAKRDVFDVFAPTKNFALWVKHPKRKFCSIVDVGYDSEDRYSLVCNLYDGTQSSERRLNGLICMFLRRNGDS